MVPQAPLTQEQLLEALADFRLSLEKRFDTFATKEDLERFATKKDLEQFATKEDLKDMSESIIDRVVEVLDTSYVTKREFEHLGS